ncbi:unnamed protein product [Protopolystoma xenopodis]|uniref:Uncharacterized protein n=1 Tax=Protopolystoma xenopodis TaxID=117903 RepID=A0A3S5AZM8_9PLAT|nr:unnamed protein product [Protopolystoma xenopodis]
MHQACKHPWTSMKGWIKFIVLLCHPPVLKVGTSPASITNSSLSTISADLVVHNLSNLAGSEKLSTELWSRQVSFGQWSLGLGANVFFELFPQACSKCLIVCQPKWYEEEILRVRITRISA